MGGKPSRNLSKENLNQSAYGFFEADQDQNRAFLQDYGLLTKNNKKIIDSFIKVILNNQKMIFTEY